ncbi:hypothetical protein AB833_21155 [Chromatiales bacterium (ex Bugula neritina AB1)]|nr:hypothetical protein AB833_21155 [Chromatiales bacterium (ex Bugula neritina AB1)]
MSQVLGSIWANSYSYSTKLIAIAGQKTASAVDHSFSDRLLDEDRARLSNPAVYLQDLSDKLIILDEIHRTSQLFSVLRSIIDANRRAGKRTGQFVILESAGPAL